MSRGRPHGRGHAPGMGRYVWGSVLLHLCVAVGLSLWSGADEREALMPAGLPLRVALLPPSRMQRSRRTWHQKHPYRACRALTRRRLRR